MTTDDRYEQLKRKRIECAEVLVPGMISFDNIVGAIVVSEEVKNNLEDNGFQKEIVVKPKVFF